MYCGQSKIWRVFPWDLVRLDCAMTCSTAWVRCWDSETEVGAVRIAAHNLEIEAVMIPSEGEELIQSAIWWAPDFRRLQEKLKVTSGGIRRPCGNVEGVSGRVQGRFGGSSGSPLEDQ